MPDQDISKHRSFQNWQVIAIISITISATVFVTGTLYQIDQNSQRIEYFDERHDRKDAKQNKLLENLQREIKELKEDK